MRLIDLDKVRWTEGFYDMHTGEQYAPMMFNTKECLEWATAEAEVKAIPVEQLLSILPKYDDYIHMKTYLYNENMEDIYSKGYEDGWNVCLKHIKEELDYWEKENEID